MKPGQMLVEAVVALAVAMIVMVALVQVATRSIKNSDFSRSQAEATSYANEGLEWVRSQRNLGWTQFYDNITCGVCGDLGGGFNRSMTFNKNPGPPQQVEVTVTVTWAEAGKSFPVKQDAIFTRF